jgi:hypothetical protein
MASDGPALLVERGRREAPSFLGQCRMASRHPPTPEVWALAMLGILAVLAVVTLVFYFLGAMTLSKLGWIAGMLLLGALSVGLRYLGNAGPLE